MTDILQYIRQWQRHHPSNSLTYLTTSSLAYNDSVAKSQANTLITNIFGLIGAHGDLPLNDSDQVLRQLKNKQPALLAFYQIFHQRLIELYYQAWQQQQVYVDYEKPSSSQTIKLLCQYLGIPFDPTTDMLAYPNFFANNLASEKRLQQLLRDYTQLPVSILRSQSKTVKLPQQQLTQLSRKQNSDNNNCLGQSWVLGTKIRMDAWHFTIVVTVDDISRYQQLMRDKSWQQQIKTLALAYVGSHYRASISIQLKQQQYPSFYLDANQASTRLGITTYI